MDQRILKHYLKGEVQREIVEFCRGRWIALEAKPIRGKRIFYRYVDDRPLTINEQADVKKIINRFSEKNIRTIYGTVNVYNEISSREDLKRVENVSRTTPSIDVDGSLEEVDSTIKAVKFILDELHHHDIDKSIYLIWSGRGVHIHLNEKAVSQEYWRPNPVKTAHAIVEYILRQVKDKLKETAARSKNLKIENIIDMQRVFTSPLSIHRELDIVAVTVNPDEVENFNVEWARLDGFRYWRGWNQYVEGELDNLVEKALKEVKSDSITRTTIEGVVGMGSRVEPIENQSSRKAVSIGRFQVMALMQAARYYVLRGDIEKAKSFGLNRAIFYAWAKKRGIAFGAPSIKPLSRRERRIGEEETIGGEVVYRSPSGWYVIGGQEQVPRDFDRQIVQRFGGRERFNKYWEAALKYIQKFPMEVVESPKEFYERVYLPLRDDLNKIFSE